MSIPSSRILLWLPLLPLLLLGGCGVGYMMEVAVGTAERQGIRGRVADAATGQTLPQVRVTIRSAEGPAPKRPYYVYSGRDGVFQLNRVNESGAPKPAPVEGTGKSSAGKGEAPKLEAPKLEGLKLEGPKPEALKPDAPGSEAKTAAPPSGKSKDGTVVSNGLEREPGEPEPLRPGTRYILILSTPSHRIRQVPVEYGGGFLELGILELSADTLQGRMKPVVPGKITPEGQRDPDALRRIGPPVF